MSAPQRIVIVGNGIAGVTAADTLRAVGFDGEIALVGDEPHPAYSRPALSKALLRDERDVASHLLPPPQHGASELRGVRVTGLDRDTRTVRLDNGEILPFDGLVIATGCRARRLAAAGEDGVEELTLRTIEDALELRRRVVTRRSVLVLGGGPLGMEIASGALEAGCQVTLVSPGPPLARQLGAFLSGILVSAALSRGLRIVSGAATSLVRSHGGTRVMLADGGHLEADIVVTAVGDEPNVEWLAGSGLLHDGALAVDGWGGVAPGIVAAGDVASVPTPFGVRRVPLWNAAIEQSRVAAEYLVRGVADQPESHPYFWTEQFGSSVRVVGHLPLRSMPVLVDGDLDDGRLLVHWPGAGTPHGGGAAAVNYRIPIPRLRRLGQSGE